MGHYLSRSLRSLMVHKLRTLLSTLGVLFGVVAVIAMLSIGEGAKQETLEQIEQLGMNSLIIRQIDMTEEQQQLAREKRSRGLSLSDGETIARLLPNVQHYAPIKVIEAMIVGCPQEIAPELLATTPSYSSVKGLVAAEGRLLGDFDVERRQAVCVLGHEVARSLGSLGHVGETIRIENSGFQVVGILKPKEMGKGKAQAVTVRNLNQTILIPLGSDQLLPQKSVKPYLNELIVQLNHSNSIPESLPVVQHLLERQHYGVEDYQIVIPQELLNQAQRTQRTFNLVLGSIAAISLLVGGIGIMNIMLATVSERTREIGIRRAVGANKRHILLQFLSETLLLTLTGAFLGIFIGILASHLISYIAEWKTIVQPWAILLALGMSSGVGLISGLYPALKAASMNPIAALRCD